MHDLIINFRLEKNCLNFNLNRNNYYDYVFIYTFIIYLLMKALLLLQHYSFITYVYKL